MTNYIIFIFIVFAAAAYWSRRRRTSGRFGVRAITIYGLAFCAASFNLWAMTRMDDIIASLPGTHSSGIFATPWPWISALVVGVTLLMVSFFTRRERRNAA
jgi:hypothetical protein